MITAIDVLIALGLTDQTLRARRVTHKQEETPHIVTIVDREMADETTDPASRQQRWEGLAEWPLAACAAIFLALFSVKVLAQPQA